MVQNDLRNAKVISQLSSKDYYSRAICEMTVREFKEKYVGKLYD